MTLKEVMDQLKYVVFYNKSNLKQLEDANIVRLINGSLTHLHSIFNIRYEQAIIVVPEIRHTFILKDEDPHVIMSTYNKFAIAELDVERVTQQSQLDRLFAIRDEIIRRKKELLNTPVPNTIRDVFIKESRDEVLQIVGVEDNRNRKYILNQRGAFMLSPEQIYLPNVMIDDIVYVIYKPKPKEVSLSLLDEPIDLPDTLLRVLYAHIGWVLTTNTIGYDGNKYPSLYQTYEKELIAAQQSMAVAPDNYEPTLHLLKGFY